MLYLIVAVIIFIIVDILIRLILKTAKENTDKKNRMKALESGLQIDFSQESKSLKRVEVDKPKARILCVDDEKIILDSFRKILVLDGYSVDTVENGSEALPLLRTNHYDFVYVDLKMPGMSGVEVTKAVKHIRPDIDVVIITGYASVDTAVETMKYGAMDYVEKPFTEDELLGFTGRCLIKRQERIKAELGPRVQIAEVSDFVARDVDQFSIPGGVFISEGHCWLSLNENGSAKIGIDDFAKKMVGQITEIDPPNIGRVISSGEPLFNIRIGRRIIPFVSPVSGKIIKLNDHLLENADLLDMNCYNKNWICQIDMENFEFELQELKIGKLAVLFYQEEIEKCQAHFRDIVEERKKNKKLAGQNGFCFGRIDKLTDKEWNKTVRKFFTK